MVAAKIRGHEPYSVEIDAEGRGTTSVHFRGTADRPFHLYAGPWAEARYQWELVKRRPGFPDEDEDGLTIDYHQLIYFLKTYREHHGDFAALREYRRATAMKDCNEKVWDRELERFWPMIVEDAALIMAGKWEPKEKDQVEADMERLSES